MKLNLGCGSDYREGYINVDHPLAATRKDNKVDLDYTPWPWASNSADEILMQDCLEHLYRPEDKIREAHRVLKPGGIFWGGVPYAFSDGAVQAADHRWLFTEKTFDVFCEGRSNSDYIGPPLFRVEYIRLTTVNNTIKTRLRDLIPFRCFWRHWLRNMYDEVEWKLIKL